MTLKELLDREEEKELNKKKGKQDHVLSVYFGVPGAGKTTMAAWLTKRDLKKGHAVYSNVPITGAFKLDPKADIGKYSLKDCRVIIDEASVEYNNRKFKELGEEAIYWFKYHRHYETAVDVFSQSHEDMDITIRRLAQRYYLMKKSIFPWFVYRKRIGKRVGINEQTRQLCDEFFFVPFGTRIIFSPVLWKMFNTLSRKELPEKDWERW